MVQNVQAIISNEVNVQTTFFEMHVKNQHLI